MAAPVWVDFPTRPMVKHIVFIFLASDFLVPGSTVPASRCHRYPSKPDFNVAWDPVVTHYLTT